MHNNKKLYDNIMRNLSKNIKRIVESIEIPENDEDSTEFEINDAIKLCLAMLDTDGGAYLDWGATGDMYKNVNSKRVADAVGEKFQEKGYFVYYTGYGLGNSRIQAGTPVALRIRKRPISLGEFDSEF